MDFGVQAPHGMCARGPLLFAQSTPLVERVVPDAPLVAHELDLLYKGLPRAFKHQLLEECCPLTMETVARKETGPSLSIWKGAGPFVSVE